MIDQYADEDDEYITPYEDGHWQWNEITNELEFLSHVFKPAVDVELPGPAVLGPLQFRDDIDLIEQQRFRKRFQRKACGENDIVLLQDIKDVVFFTAPTYILSTALVKVLHLQTTERFIRALILYCQYYLQITEELSKRVLQQETKVPTPNSAAMEAEFSENLEELRLLVAKEYATIIVGGNDFKRFHHMGPNKKSNSLSKKDAILFESILLICIQIVWLALGRTSLNQIDLEVHRLFKTQQFNVTDHKLHFEFESKMTPHERLLLTGPVQNQNKIHKLSPLMNSLNAPLLDFRLFGLGTLKCSKLTYRQQYFEKILTTREESFKNKNITLGILGLPRSHFDTMLKKIDLPVFNTMSSVSVRARSTSKSSRASLRKSNPATGAFAQKLYPDIVLPDKTYDEEWLPSAFPAETFPTFPVNQNNKVQQHKWLARAIRRTDKRQKGIKSRIKSL